MMNLQLFSEDVEEIESGGYQGEEKEKEELLDDETLDDDLEEEDLEDDLEGDDEDNPSLDKKTKAIIKHKREAKAYKDQAQVLQDKLDAIAFEKEEANRIKELTQGGESLDTATKIVKDEFEVKKLRTKLAALELSKLEGKYPGISKYSKELSESKQILPEFSYEQIYLANFSKQNEFDRRTQLEQEILYKNKTAREKSLEGSNANTSKAIKLSSQDERTYRFMKQSRPSMTRKQFRDLLQVDTLE